MVPAQTPIPLAAGVLMLVEPVNNGEQELWFISAADSTAARRHLRYLTFMVPFRAATRSNHAGGICVLRFV